MIGNDAQLVPVILSQPGFVQQLMHGLLPHLKTDGHPSAILPEQHRAVPGLSDLISRLFNGGILTNAPGTEMSARPMARAITRFIAREYQVPNTCAILLEVKGYTGKNSTRLLYNYNSATVILELVEKLLAIDVVKPLDMSVLTYY